MTEPVDDFEIDAIAIKETETALLIMKAGFAFEARDRKASSWLAHLWGCSPQEINRLAQMFEEFGIDIQPDISLALYGAAMETDQPGYALRLATDIEFRREELGEEYAATDKEGDWSPSKLRRHFNILKGKHLSTAFRGRVTITEWDVSTGHVAAKGLRISGNMPVVAEMMVREVLQE